MARGDKMGQTSHAKWSPTGKARGTSIEIPSYAKASEGYPPVAKSTEASSFGHMNNLATSYYSSMGKVRGLLRRWITSLFDNELHFLI